MTLKSEKERDESPEIASSDISALTDGNDVFAFNLYKLVSHEEGNLFYSPYSISQALAMAYVGARGNTEKQMSDTLRFTMSQKVLHPVFNGLDIELGKRGEGTQGKDGEGFRLNIVNAIWGQKDYKFLSEFAFRRGIIQFLVFRARALEFYESGPGNRGFNVGPVAALHEYSEDPGSKFRSGPNKDKGHCLARSGRAVSSDHVPRVGRLVD